jgi:hypothetical protein
MNNMPARELAIWAKEEVLEFIDRGLRDKLEYGGLTFDEREALKKERSRVAKMFRLDIAFGECTE